MKRWWPLVVLNVVMAAVLLQQHCARLSDRRTERVLTEADMVAARDSARANAWEQAQQDIDSLTTEIARLSSRPRPRTDSIVNVLRPFVPDSVWDAVEALHVTIATQDSVISAQSSRFSLLERQVASRDSSLAELRSINLTLREEVYRLRSRDKRPRLVWGGGASAGLVDGNVRVQAPVLFVGIAIPF